MAKDVKIRQPGHDLDGAIFENAASNDILSKMLPSLKEVGDKVAESGKQVAGAVGEGQKSGKGLVDNIVSGFTGFVDEFGKSINSTLSGITNIAGEVFDQKASVSSTMQHLQTMLEGIGGMAGALPFVGKKLKFLGSALSGIADMVQGGVRAIEHYSKTLDYMSQSGVSFGGDILLMKNAAAAARMSLEDYANFMTKNRERIAGVGGTMTEAAAAFSSYSKEFFGSSEEYGLKLRQLGYSYDEINDMLVFNRKMNQMTNLEDERAREASMLSTMQLATEMDAISKLTGIERKQMQEDIERARQKAQVEATLMQAQLRGGKNVQEAFAASRAQMSQYSKGMQDAYDEILAYGAPVTEASKGLVAALGDGAHNLYEMANAAKEGKSIEEIGEMSDRLQDSVISMLTDPEKLGLARLVGISSSQVAEQFGDLLTGPMGQIAKNLIAEYQSQGKDFKDSAEFTAELRRRAEKEQKKMQNEGGSDTTGEAARQAMLKMQEGLKTAGVAMNDVLVGPTGMIQNSEWLRDGLDVAGDAAMAFAKMINEYVEDSDLLEKIQAADAERANAAAEAAKREAEIAEKLAIAQKSVQGTSAMTSPTGGPSKQDEVTYLQNKYEAEQNRLETELNDFLAALQSHADSTTNENLKKDLLEAGHAIKEMSEDGRFFNDVWPKLQELGETGPEMLLAARKQTGILDGLTAILDSSGLDKDDAEEIIEAVNERMKENVAVTEDHGAWASASKFVSNATNVIAGWFGAGGTAEKSFIETQTKTRETSEFVKEQSTAANQSVQDFIDQTLSANAATRTETTTMGQEMVQRFNQSMNMFDSSIRVPTNDNKEENQQLEQGIAQLNQTAEEQAEYQRKLAAYNREMAIHGMPMTPESKAFAMKLAAESKKSTEAQIETVKEETATTNIDPVVETPAIQESVKPQPAATETTTQQQQDREELIKFNEQAIQETSEKQTTAMVNVLNKVNENIVANMALTKQLVEQSDFQAGQLQQQTNLARNNNSASHRYGIGTIS